MRNHGFFHVTITRDGGGWSYHWTHNGAPILSGWYRGRSRRSARQEADADLARWQAGGGDQ